MMNRVALGWAQMSMHSDFPEAVERAEILSGPGPMAHLSGRQKAAIVVRLMLAEGVKLPLSSLPDPLQAALTEQMGRMRLVDRETLNAVIAEFEARLDSVGLAFPGGLHGALSLLDDQLSPSAASRLRRLAGIGDRTDPWERIAEQPAERLLPVLEQESLEIGSVLLSKVSVDRAAELLEKLPGDRARRLAHAMSRTGRVDPETVRRIGVALLQQFDAQAPQAFDDGPVERVGAILNSSPAATRDSVLEGLGETDPVFAQEVRRAIFTFAHIPARLAQRDVSRVLREVPGPVLLRALVAAPQAGEKEAAAADFLLGGMTQRMADNVRMEVSEHPPVETREGEEAMSEIVTVIRRLAQENAINLQKPKS